MKSLVIGFVFFASAVSYADVDVLCKRSSNLDCQIRVYEALRNLGCNVGSQSVTCSDAPDFGRGIDHCEVKDMNNCSEPHPELFGFTSKATSCFFGGKVSLKKADRGLSLDWTMGLFRSYVSDICVRK